MSNREVTNEELKRALENDPIRDDCEEYKRPRIQSSEEAITMELPEGTKLILYPCSELEKDCREMVALKNIGGSIRMLNKWCK